MKEFKPDFNRLKKVLLRDGEPDTVPFYELFADREVVETYTGKPMTPETIVEFFYKLGYDYATVGINFGYKHYSNTTDDTAQLSRGKRGFVDDNQGIIETRQDFDAYNWPVIDKSITSEIIETEKYLPDGMKSIILTPGGILENVVQLMGYIPFSYALMDDEQLIWDMFEKIGGNGVNMIRTCLEESDISKVGAVVMGDDMGYNHSTMISPDLLRKYVFPWQKKFGEVVHSYDLPFIIHSCGNLTEIMDDLIDYVEIDAKHSYEDKIMPVTEAKAKYGDRIAILGGVDVDFLCRAKEEEIRRYVDNVLEKCAPGGGYALGTGNSVTNYIPMKNYMIMLDEGRKKGLYTVI